MSTCPVLKEECIGERCRLWFKSDLYAYASSIKCLIPVIDFHLDALSRETNKLWKELRDIHIQLVDIENKM